MNTNELEQLGIKVEDGYDYIWVDAEDAAIFIKYGYESIYQELK